MTREEYIEFANALKNNYTIDFDKLPEFCDMAISALSTEGEFIKKEDTIEYLNDLFGEMHQVSFSDVIQSIDSLQTYSFPDLSENKGEWIPVSERLPEDRREVLVTAYWHETYQVMMASYFGDGLWWCVPFNNCGEHMQRLNPKAWMPLPEPYKVEGGE